MSKTVFVNQIGYKPSEKKIAYVPESLLKELEVSAFSLKTLAGEVVFTGEASGGVEDRLSGAPYCSLDFSDFKTEGEYVISVGNEESYSFRIGNGIFDSLCESILKYFYLSRCGQEIKDATYGHEACHTRPAEVYGEPGKLLNITGGWHDAGDYGRYIVAGAKTVMDLLLAYKVSEGKNVNYDILDEVRFELEWMLQLQREDGAVYHKISCYKFCSFIEPQKEQDKIVVSPVSTAATADFAGSLAFAASFYKTQDPAFSEKLLAAAEKAQSYLDTHEDELYKNPEEIRTGEYGDRCVMDERFFALCSLFDATGKSEYFEGAKQIWQKVQDSEKENFRTDKRFFFAGFGWGNVGGYGVEILINSNRSMPEKSFVNDLRENILVCADHFEELTRTSSFGSCHSFVFWGSNGAISDCAHLLFIAFDLTGDEKYRVAAKKQMDFILGCNPLGICYVTGHGSYSTKSPHHRPSFAFGKVMPGMLAGGPCEGLNDACAKEKLGGKGLPPLMCYIDDYRSYSTNEIAIYWNSPFVYLVVRCM